MKNLNLGLATLAVGTLFVSFSAFAGHGSSGGGESIVFPNGEVKFLDLMQHNEIPVTPTEPEIIQNLIYAPKRYVKQFAVKDEHFFDCAVTRLSGKANSFEAIRRLIPKLKTVKVFEIETGLLKTADEQALNDHPLPIPLAATTSPRVAAEFQEPVAAFSEGRIFVAGRIRAKMSDTDQCAVSVHEALRQLNFTRVITEDLSTTEIEIATRAIMDRPFAKDDFSSIASKLAKLEMTFTDYESQGEAKRLQAEAELKIEDKMIEQGKTLADPEVAAIHSKFVADYGQYQHLTWTGISNALHGNDQALAEMNPFFGLSFEEAMTQKLKAFHYFDVMTGKFVTRMF